MSAKITPDGRAKEVSTEQADVEKGTPIYNGAAVHAPKHWEHNNYVMTMT